MHHNIIKAMKIICTSLAVATLILYLTRNKSVFSCPAYEVFGGESHSEDFISFVTYLGIAILLWSIGFFLYVSITYLRKHINTFIYFALLTFLSMSQLIKHRRYYEPPIINLGMREEICNKGTATSMDASFTNLKREEYDHLRSLEDWLPLLPSRSDSICIRYFHDSFLGDYDITIDFRIPSNVTLDSNESLKFEKTPSGYQYHDFAM